MTGILGKIFGSGGVIKSGIDLSCFAMVLAFTLMDRVADADKVQRVLEDFQIGWAMIVILGFYFGAGAAEGFMDKKKAK